ncbi:serine/threonine protein kinase [Fluviicola chungangensis]|uniref:Protein kinase n=1 Tax=Fluviicola chungangensis TaxID=2597671 RepID=A0A556MR95_9FLAO|nr:protein kinase [Fluviicola chungangensis]TSJ42440.1 protein kinase [Fluviicola chungangensis]
MNPAEKYRILEQIDAHKKRKFAHIFLTENKVSGVKSILKTVQKTEDNQVVQDRLRKEATFSFIIDGLPETLDFFESDSEIFLFKSFQAGITLADYLEQFRSKEKARKLFEVLEQLEPILEHIHQNKIYHLDIKPGNIIVDSSKGVRVSLIDFGLAWTPNEPETRKTLFPLGFAAPELLMNRLDLVDARTDYFALGVSCWTCLQGKMPLIDPNPSITTNLQLTYPLPNLDSRYKVFSEVLQKLSGKHQFTVPPNKLNPEELKTALLKGMNKRYSKYSEFISDFEKQLNKQKKFRWFF